MIYHQQKPGAVFLHNNTSSTLEHHVGSLLIGRAIRATGLRTILAAFEEKGSGLRDDVMSEMKAAQKPIVEK